MPPSCSAWRSPRFPLGKRRAGDGAGRARAGRASAVRQAGRGGGSGAGPIGRCRSVADAPGLRPESRAAGLLAVARRRVRRALVRADGRSLWRYATRKSSAWSGAGNQGWRERRPRPPSSSGTGANRSDEVPIRQGACPLDAHLLADGGAAGRDADAAGSVLAPAFLRCNSASPSRLAGMAAQ